MLTSAGTAALVLSTYGLADNMGNPGLLLAVALAVGPAASACYGGLAAQGLLQTDALLDTVTADGRDMSTGAPLRSQHTSRSPPS